MKYYAGHDLSVKETSVCIVDEAGKLCRELKVLTHPEDLVRALKDPAWKIVRIGLEAGPLSQWVFEGLSMAGLPAICIETRHTKAFLKAQVNKSDRNDARGIAQMMPLLAVATFEQTEGANQISRENGKRRVVTTAEVRGRDIGSLVTEAQAKVAEEVKLLPGSYLAYQGRPPGSAGVAEV